MIVKNDLYDYKERYIYQDSEAFKFSLDSILLAEFVDIPKDNETIIDMCAGNMAAGLILSKYTNAHITGFEIQENIYKLGKDSISINNLDNLKIINDDIKNIGKYFPKYSVDKMLCNPPFFNNLDDKILSKDDKKKIARHEISISLEDLFAIASTYLKEKGILYMVHRVNRIDELFIYANKYGINIKHIQFISTKKGKIPMMVLIKCVKNSKFGVKINNELCIEGLNTYQNIFRSSL